LSKAQQYGAVSAAPRVRAAQEVSIVKNPIPATVVALVIWVLLSATVIPLPAALAEDVFGVGFWKNHPEAWAVDELTLDGVTYTKDQLLQILNTPSGGDVTYRVATQLIAALLNVMSGAVVPAEVAEALDSAQEFLAEYRLGTAPTAPAALLEAERIVTTLTAFNEGTL